MNRSKLLEHLNRVKAETSNTAVASTSTPSNTVSFNINSDSIFSKFKWKYSQVNPNFPRGAGRAKLFHPQLLNRLTLNSPGENSSTHDNSSTTSDAVSTISTDSEEHKPIDKAGQKGK